MARNNVSDDLQAALEAAASEVDGSPAKPAAKRKVPQAPAPGGLPKASSGQTGAGIPAFTTNTDGKSGARKLPTIPPATAKPGQTGDLLASTTLSGGKSASHIRGVSMGAPPARGTIPPMPPPAPGPKATMSGPNPPASARTPLPKRPGHDTGPLPPRGIQLIDYDPEEGLIDHKGRSKPLYKPRTQRPDVWKPSKPVRVLLGLFPGARVMALESARLGVTYAVFGLVALAGALSLIIGWSRTEAALRNLLIDERWMLAYAAAMVALLFLFELLRLASSFEERTGHGVSRILAALFIPSTAILIMGPDLVHAWPSMVEPAWFCAFILAIGGIAGGLWCTLEGTLETPRGRLIFRMIGLVVVALLVVTLVVTQATSRETLRIVALTAGAHGFKKLPALLSFAM